MSGPAAQTKDVREIKIRGTERLRRENREGSGDREARPRKVNKQIQGEEERKGK